jgi:heme/copper-type cytochrome/quinol oxidase subunit 1
MTNLISQASRIPGLSFIVGFIFAIPMAVVMAFQPLVHDTVPVRFVKAPFVMVLGIMVGVGIMAGSILNADWVDTREYNTATR